jgi:hypothetical protein
MGLGGKISSIFQWQRIASEVKTEGSTPHPRSASQPNPAGTERGKIEEIENKATKERKTQTVVVSS